MILVSKSTTKGYSIGHWPIPEDHWIDVNTKQLVNIDFNQGEDKY